MTHEDELCVTSRLTNLTHIAEYVAERAARAGLNEEEVFAVQMAVDEACTNSIEHGYQGAENGEVRVCCYTENDDFIVRITDFGRAFDPSSVPEPDLSGPLEERQIGGLGLFFMRKLMDSVEFVCNVGGCNQILMRKRIRVAKKS